MTDAVAEPLIGVINAGSSSLKFSFYEGEKRLLAGQVDGIGVNPKASATGPDGETIAPPEVAGKKTAAPSELLPALIPWARERLGGRRLAALGHRVVHGGLHHSRPARVTPELLAELDALVPLAPLPEPHPRPNRRLLCLIRFIRRAFAATAFTACLMNTSPRCCHSGRRRWPMAG